MSKKSKPSKKRNTDHSYSNVALLETAASVFILQLHFAVFRDGPNFFRPDSTFFEETYFFASAMPTVLRPRSYTE